MRDERQLSLLDSPLRTDVRNDRRMMAWNFFALDIRGKVMEPLIYDDGARRIEVKPGHDGMANVLDKDFLIYVASLMREKLDRGEVPSQKFTFTANDFFRVAGRATGGTGYDSIERSMDRLQGTQIKTNIKTGDLTEREWFSWINRGKFASKMTKTGRELRGTITVELCDWLYRAILHDGLMLKYHPAYFDLDPLPRRMYEVALSFVGDDDGFLMPLEVLHRQIGTQSEPKHLKQAIKAAIEKDLLPDFRLGFADDRDLDAGEILPDKRIPLKHLIVVFLTRKASDRNRPKVSDLRRWSEEVLVATPEPSQAEGTPQETPMT